MVGPHSANREPGDDDRLKRPSSGDHLIKVGLKQGDLYAPLFLEVADLSQSALEILKGTLPELPWSVITDYLLPRIRSSETIEVGALIEQAGDEELPVITQRQRFLLLPFGGAEESEHRISVTGGEASLTEKALPTIQLVKNGALAATISARIEFSKQGLEERWSIVDSITQSLGKFSASEQAAVGPYTNFKIASVLPGLTLGLFSLTPGIEHGGKSSHGPARGGRRSWVPQDLSVRDPSYSDHQVMASHAFPARGEEIVSSGLLPHLEAFVEQEKGISLSRLSRMARTLRSPLRVSVWRGYNPARATAENFDKWAPSSEDGASSTGYESPSSSEIRHQLLSLAEVTAPIAVESPRALSFIGASAQSEYGEERRRVLGRLKLAFLPSGLPVGSAGQDARDFVNSRWHDLLGLMRDLNLPATKKELMGLLREIRDRGAPEGTELSTVRLTIQDSSDPEGTRAISPRFDLTRVS